MARQRGVIRVGLIGCSRRALWYGAIFDAIDPVIYSELDPAGYHYMTYCYCVKLMVRPAKGFRLARVYDADPKAAKRLARAFGGRPAVCAAPQQVSDGVDLVFIANESGDGGDHLALARPGLLKGVPTFIDRPFAATVRDAETMIALARRRRTPLLSCSHMRLLPHAAWFKARLREIAPVGRGMVHGGGPNPALMADGIALATFIFGDAFGGRPDSVQSMGSWPLELLHLRYEDSRLKRRHHLLVINSHSLTQRQIFSAKAEAAAGRQIDADELDARVQPEGGLAVMNALRRMVRTGKPPISSEEMLDQVAIMEAGRKAHNRTRPVPLAGVRANGS